MTSILRTDIFPPELGEEPSGVTIRGVDYSSIVQQATVATKQRSPGPAKNLYEFFELVKKIILDYERRENITNDAKIIFTEEEPDYRKESGITITFSIERREPGMISRDRAFQASSVKNLVPMLRDETEDPDNPGYKRAVFGYFHDNEVVFTIWAKTNKVANDRALWFEGLMQEYSWYFTSQGISRLLFMKREKDFVSDVGGQKLYGRPLHFYIRTETLRTISEKKLEEISIGTMVDIPTTELNK